MELSSGLTLAASFLIIQNADIEKRATIDRNRPSVDVFAVVAAYPKPNPTTSSKLVSIRLDRLNMAFCPIRTENVRILNIASPLASGTSFIKATMQYIMRVKYT